MMDLIKKKLEKLTLYSSSRVGFYYSIKDTL